MGCFLKSTASLKGEDAIKAKTVDNDKIVFVTSTEDAKTMDNNEYDTDMTYPTGEKAPIKESLQNINIKYCGDINTMVTDVDNNVEYITFKNPSIAPLYLDTPEEKTNIAYSSIDVYNRLNVELPIDVMLSVHSITIWNINEVLLYIDIDKEKISSYVLSISIDEDITSREWYPLVHIEDNVYKPMMTSADTSYVSYMKEVLRFNNKKGIIKIAMRIYAYLEDEQLIEIGNSDVFFGTKINKSHVKYNMYKNLYYEMTNMKIANILIDVSYENRIKEISIEEKCQMITMYPYIEYLYNDYDMKDNKAILGDEKIRFNSVGDISYIDINGEQFDILIDSCKNDTDSIVEIFMKINKRFFLYDMINRISTMTTLINKKQKKMIATVLINKLRYLSIDDKANDLLFISIIKCITHLLSSLTSALNASLIKIIIEKVIYHKNEKVIYYVIDLLSKLFNERTQIDNEVDRLIQILIFHLSSKVQFTNILPINILSLLVTIIKKYQRSSFLTSSLFIIVYKAKKEYKKPLSLLIQLYTLSDSEVDIDVLKKVKKILMRHHSLIIIEPIIALIKSHINIMTFCEDINIINNIAIILTTTLSYIKLNASSFPLHNSIVICYTTFRIINEVVNATFRRVLYLNQIEDKIIDVLFTFYASTPKENIQDRILSMRMIYYAMNIAVDIAVTFNDIDVNKAKRMIMLVKILQKNDNNDVNNTSKGFKDYYLRYKNMMIKFLNIAIKVIKDTNIVNTN